MTERLGWAVVGAGRRAVEVMIPALTASPLSRLIGVCGSSADQARKAAAAWPELEVFETLSEAVKDPRVEAVYISTPHYLHVPHAVQSIEAEKHVFIEAPLALSVDGANKIVEKARKRGIKVGIAFQRRFHPALARLRELIEDDEIGELRHLSARFCDPPFHPTGWWSDESRAGPNTFLRSGIHALDLLAWLKGQEIAEVAALATEAGDPPVNTACSLIMRFPDQTTALALTASDCGEPGQALDLEGSRGRIKLEGDLSGADSALLAVTRQGKTETIEFEPDDSVGRMIDAFTLAVQKDQLFSPDACEGLAIVRAACAAIEAMKARRVVRVGEILRLV